MSVTRPKIIVSDEYMAVLWKADPLSLLWTVDTSWPVAPAHEGCRVIDRAPTWSWASIDLKRYSNCGTSISFERIYHPQDPSRLVSNRPVTKDKKFKVLDWSCDVGASSIPFGSVSVEKSHLKVSGLVLTSKMIYGEERSRNPDVKIGSGGKLEINYIPKNADWEYDPMFDYDVRKKEKDGLGHVPDGSTVLLLRVGVGHNMFDENVCQDATILLVPSTTKPAKYERIGTITIRGGPKSQRAFQSAEEMVLEII